MILLLQPGKNRYLVGGVMTPPHKRDLTDFDPDRQHHIGKIVLIIHGSEDDGA